MKFIPMIRFMAVLLLFAPFYITAQTIYTTSGDSSSFSNLANNNLNKSIQLGMFGSYTIGVDNADFPDLQMALDAVMTCGIIGDVYLQLQSDVYRGNYQLQEYNGRTEYQLFIESITGNKDDVALISDISNNESNPMFRLTNTNNLTFRNLRIRPNLAVYDYTCFELIGHHENLLIENIKGEFVNNLYGAGTILQVDYDGITFSNLTIKDSQFSGSGLGVFMSSNTEGNNFQFNNNQVDVLDNAISLNQVTDIEMINNNIMMTSTEDGNTQQDGISIVNAHGTIDIKNNQVRCAHPSPLYIYFSSNQIDPPTANIVNNYFSMNSNAHARLGHAITIDRIAALNFLHNTVRVKLLNDPMSPNKYNAALLVKHLTNNHRILNNIIQAGGDALALELAPILESPVVNHNAYFYEGEYFAGQNPNLYTDLNGWQNALSIDANSFITQIAFNDTDSYQTTDLSLDSQAQSLAEVTTDIEDQSRHTIMPDIGAYEFTPPQLDAAIVDFTTPECPFTAGTQPLVATLRNVGTMPITSTVIEVMVNGQVVQSMNWSGNLAAGETILIDLGTIEYLPIEENVVSVTSTLPNNMTDEQPANNATSKNSLYAGLAGEYSVGMATADFPDWEEIPMVLVRNGVVGETTFNFSAGDYFGFFRLFEIKRSQPDLQVIFQSAEQDAEHVVFYEENEEYSFNGIWALQDINNVTLQHLTFATRNGSTPLDLRGANNIVRNCKFVKVSNHHIGALLRLRPSSLVGGENNRIENNIFTQETTERTGRPIAMLIEGSLGANSRLNNTIIEHNDIELLIGIRLERSNHTIIRANTFKTAEEGLESFSSGGLLIENNKFYPTAFGNGISLSRGSALVEQSSIIQNNYFGTHLMESSAFYYPIRVIGGHDLPLKIVHNSINMSADISGFGLYLGQLKKETIVQNNIFVVENTQMVSILDSEQLPDLDHNVYYSSIGKPKFSIGETRSIFTYEGLEDWREVTDFANNSVFTNPYFILGEDYKIQNRVIRSVSNPTFSTAFDIEDQVRFTDQPTPGAYEAAPLAIDVAATAFPELEQGFSNGTQMISLRIENIGQTTVEDFTINWSVDNIEQTPVVWSGNLTAGSTIEVALGEIEYEVNRSYRVAAIVNLTTLTDEFLPNNEFILENVRVRLGGTYTVGGSNADFPDIITAMTELNDVGVIAPVTFSVRTGTYALNHSSQGLEIHNYYGNDINHPVTLTAATGNAADVHLIVPAQGGFKLSETDGFVFQNLTFNSDFGDAIVLNRTTKNITIDHCVFEFEEDARRSVYALSGDNLTITNCDFSGGNEAIYVYPNREGTTHSSNVLQIENNVFTNQANGAISIVRKDNILIQNNRIESNTNNSSSPYRAIFLFNIGKGSINANTIIGEHVDFSGIHHEIEAFATFINDVSIVNNFINIHTTDGTGLWVKAANKIQIFHNTIVGEYANQAACLLSHLPEVELEIEAVGNIFANYGSHYALSYADDFKQLNYNLYYAPNHSLISNGSEIFTNLDEWKTALPQYNQNSLELDPVLNDNSYDYMANQVNNAIPYNSQIPTDIEGKNRSTDMTDIGCFEKDFALAINWEDFSVKLLSDNTVQLDWGLIHNMDDSYFIIQRSDLKKKEKNIGKVTATTTEHYQFIDQEPLLGDNYYRVVATNVQGMESFTPWKKIVLNKVLVQAYPNPTRQFLYLNYPSEISPLSLKIIDNLGRTIQQLNSASLENQIKLDVSTYNSGTYLILIETEKENYLQRFTKQ